MCHYSIHVPSYVRSLVLKKNSVNKLKIALCVCVADAVCVHTPLYTFYRDLQRALLNPIQAEYDTNMSGTRASFGVKGPVRCRSSGPHQVACPQAIRLASLYQACSFIKASASCDPAHTEWASGVRSHMVPIGHLACL